MKLMSMLSAMHPAGIVVIFTILILFILAVILLFYTYTRYRALASKLADGDKISGSFMKYCYSQFSSSYERYGSDTNTPAIISDAVSTKLSGLQLCERFLNNAVSLFVTLGLFGTFLGLSLSVGSLTELIGYSDTSEWLSALDSLGSGLLSALSGMGVAFYTSLVGVACAIILTILRAIFSPAAARELMETRCELWLDEAVAPELKTRAANSDVELVHQMIDALNDTSDAMSDALQASTAALQNSVAALQNTLTGFDKSVEGFNNGVHDFKEINYNLSGTVERFDLVIRDITRASRYAQSKAAASAEKEKGAE